MEYSLGFDHDLPTQKVKLTIQIAQAQPYKTPQIVLKDHSDSVHLIVRFY